jgi:tRNA (cytidine/uridine-2'-O-)-methyltransferase
MDYSELACVREHASLGAFQQQQPARLFACSTRAGRTYSEAGFQPGDALLFGPETRGLPQELLDNLPPQQLLRIPMVADSRSLNLSNSVAVILYEAWRQQGFRGSGR